MTELTDIKIDIRKLTQMHPGKILGAYLIEDMYHKNREVLKIRWIENSYGHQELRTSYFAIDNGEYCGEAL